MQASSTIDQDGQKIQSKGKEVSLVVQSIKCQQSVEVTVAYLFPSSMMLTFKGSRLYGWGQYHGYMIKFLLTISILIFLFCPGSELLNHKVAKEHYEDIVQRQQLVDLAKAQAQELSILQAEVERLRMKTFPAFFDVQEY